MQKRWLIVFALLVIPIVSAAEETVFSQTVTAGEHQTSKGEPFTLSIAGDKASVRLLSTGFVVENGTCARDSIYEVCADISFSHYNHSIAPGYEVLKAALVITQNVATLDVNRTINQDTLLVGGQANYSLTLFNPTSQALSDLSFTDELTEYIDVFLLSGSDCVLNGNVLRYSGELAGLKRVECFALLQGKTPGSAATTLAGSYLSGSELKTLSASKTIVVEEYPLTVAVNITPVLDIGDEAKLSVVLRAAKNLTLSEYSLVLPAQLSVLSVTNATTHNVTLIASRTLVAGEEHRIVAQVRAAQTGNGTLESDVQLRVQGISQSFSQQDSVVVTADQPVVHLLSSDGELRFLISNPTGNDFQNVRLSLEGEVVVSDAAAQFSDLTRRGHQSFATDFVAVPGTHSIVAVLQYESAFDEQFEQRQELNFTIAGEAPVQAPAAGQSETQPVQPREQGPALRYAAISLGVVAALFAAFVALRSRKGPKTADVYAAAYKY